MTLWHAVGENDEKMFQRIMDEAIIRPLDAGDIYRAMDCAAAKGYAIYLERLAPLSTPTAHKNAFKSSAGHGNIQCLKVLQPYISAEDDCWLRSFEECANNSLLVGALLCFPSNCDHVACLDLLAPYVSKDEANRVLAFMGGQCSVEILNVLLKYADPQYNNSRALQRAVKENAQRNIDILYPISDPVAALKVMQEGVLPKCTPEDWMPLYERIESERLKSVLTNEVKSTSAMARTHKI